MHANIVKKNCFENPTTSCFHLTRIYYSRSSYAALQKGYIHHALRDLTGCESEWIPLASASRFGLWFCFRTFEYAYNHVII